MKKEVMKKNGFTLIELLAVLVILGILATIAIQTYFVLEKNNDESKYSYYLEVIKTGTELYLENKKDEMENGACLSVKYSTLVRKNVIKEEDITCEGSILLKRTGKKFEYDDSLLECKTKSTGKILKEKSETSTTNCTILQDTDIYYITYDANGGVGAPPGQTKTHGISILIPETIPTRTGYIFKGWSTNQESTTASYIAGGKFNEDGDLTLYAVWELETYTITFQANGGTGAPEAMTKTYGIDLTIPDTIPSRNGFVFDGWARTQTATTPDYTVGSSFSENQDTTLFAVWSKPSHTVTYNYSYNGGTSASTVSTTVTEGEAIDLTPTATKSGYTFLGWNTTASATSKLSSLTMGTSNVTLYAIYYKTLTITLWDYSGTSRGARYLYPVLWNKSTASTKVTLPALRTATNECGSYGSQGWSTSSSATASTNYSANGSYSFSANTTLYARYNQTRTLTIDDNGGDSNNYSQINTYYLNGSGSLTVINRYGSTISTAPWSYTFADNCRRSGKTFAGWNGSYYKGSTITWRCSTMYSAYWR